MIYWCPTCKAASRISTVRVSFEQIQMPSCAIRDHVLEEWHEAETLYQLTGSWRQVVQWAHLRGIPAAATEYGLGET